jgi:exonuclease III
MKRPIERGRIRCTTYCFGGEQSEVGVAIVVHKSKVESVVKMIVCNDRLVAVKINAEPVNVSIAQVYMPTSDYEDEEVEELHDRIEDILEENGKDYTNTIIMGDWNSIVGDKFVDHMDWGRETKETKCLLTSVKELYSLSLTRGLRSLRENCILGKLQAIDIGISWIIYLRNSGSEIV